MDTNIYIPQIGSLPFIGTSKDFHIIFLVDTSKNMDKYDGLLEINKILENTLSDLRQQQVDFFSECQIKLSMFSFDSMVKWIITSTSVMDVMIPELTSNDDTIDFDNAFRELNEKLTDEELMAHTGKIVPSLVFLITCQENLEAYKISTALTNLQNNKWFKVAHRCVALNAEDMIKDHSNIGEFVKRFAGENSNYPEICVLNAMGIEIHRHMPVTLHTGFSSSIPEPPVRDILDVHLPSNSKQVGINEEIIIRRSELLRCDPEKATESLLKIKYCGPIDATFFDPFGDTEINDIERNNIEIDNIGDETFYISKVSYINSIRIPNGYSELEDGLVLGIDVSGKDGKEDNDNIKIEIKKEKQDVIVGFNSSGGGVIKRIYVPLEKMANTKINYEDRIYFGDECIISFTDHGAKMPFFEDPDW